MIRHEKLDKMADLDKFFAKAKLRLEDIQIVHVSTKMAGFYMVFYDDGLPYPEKGTSKRPGVKTVKEDFNPAALVKDVDTAEQLYKIPAKPEDEIVLTPVDKVQQGIEET